MATLLPNFSASAWNPSSGVTFNGANGSHPGAELIQGSDGNFYFCAPIQTFTYSSDGTVFQLTPGGVLTALLDFNGTNGAFPQGSLLQGSDGNLYFAGV